MLSPEDKNTILDFICSSDENLELALGVLAVRNDLMMWIIREFLKKLEIKLNGLVHDLGSSWTVVNRSKDELNGNVKIWLTKKEWNNFFRIGLGAERSGPKEFIVGVVRLDDKLVVNEDAVQMSMALNEKLGPGKTGPWWPYHLPLKDDAGLKEYSDWSNPRNLMQLIGKRGQLAIDDISDVMLCIAKESEKTLDSLFEEWRKLNSGAVLPPLIL